MSFKVTQTALLTLPQGPEYQFAAVDFEATDQLTIRSEQGHAAARRSGVPKFLSFPTTTESYTTTTTTTASRHEAAPVSRSHSPVVIRRSRNEILGRLQCIHPSLRKVETYILPPACGVRMKPRQGSMYVVCMFLASVQPRLPLPLL